mmetsp:Transcript_45204/g.109394  ORF Transcript_45204/g.109394 Transcript_45204/m.109394 type:complete len:551 (+) Transcript_45204:52-1704(+)
MLRTLQLSLLLSSLLDSDASITPRIVGGQATKKGAFPFMTHLSNREQVVRCGGTLISPRVVLTAAHCRETILDSAHIGLHDSSHLYDSGVEARNILIEKVHPMYDNSTLESDLMLLLLDQPVFEHEPVTLYQGDADFVPDQELWALGWGVTSAGSIADELQMVQLEFLANEQCRRSSGFDEEGVFTTYLDYIYDDMLCTHFTDGNPRDACIGDSGGPILSVDRQQGSVMQVGTTSWGMGCGDPNFPGVSTRIGSHYESFIRPWVCRLDEHALPSFNCTGIALDSVTSESKTPQEIASGMVRLWIVIYMDCWPEEVAWTLELVQESGEKEIVAGRKKGNNNDWADTVSEYFDIPPAKDYVFTIYDDYGDGLKYGGSYALFIGGPSLEDAERILESGGNYGRMKSLEFSTPALAIPASSPTYSSAIPSDLPSLVPSSGPSQNSEIPSDMPSLVPSVYPTRAPVTTSPTGSPTKISVSILAPSEESVQPTGSPTEIIGSVLAPSEESAQPSGSPTHIMVSVLAPSEETEHPTASPKARAPTETTERFLRSRAQ